ncbi:hypothetical protein QUF49_00395 [Fictibacillus sp. b24]|uniref:hypothetical protein n=1 Tax=Fictibacillus sp. b24 TaxID=3055863 RepID=UPI0025A0D150|nr:hypothetical protein [Fictibacillus sp. b24]MDM5314437.1 hypothetical protein [Fictibacillus sp. b24]
MKIHLLFLCLKKIEGSRKRKKEEDGRNHLPARYILQQKPQKYNQSQHDQLIQRPSKHQSHENTPDLELQTSPHQPDQT